jgi:hypothetical protein
MIFLCCTHVFLLLIHKHIFKCSTQYSFFLTKKLPISSMRTSKVFLNRQTYILCFGRYAKNVECTQDCQCLLYDPLPLIQMPRPVYTKYPCLLYLTDCSTSICRILSCNLTWFFSLTNEPNYLLSLIFFVIWNKIVGVNVFIQLQSSADIRTNPVIKLPF